MGFPGFRSSTGFHRAPAFGSRRINFGNDGKPHAVLDTNILLNAMWALQKGSGATAGEGACLQIIEAVADQRITIAMTSRVKEEYLRKAAEHAAKGKLRQTNVEKVLRVLDGPNIVDFRFIVDHAGHVESDPDDDVLFNGLSAEYLVSADKHLFGRDVRRWNRSPYGRIMRPIEFVKTVLKI